MKKWLILGVCLLTSVVFAGSSYNDKEAFKALLNGEKTEKLSRKVVQFYVSHPKTAEYFYKGGDVISSILEEYCTQTEQLIQRYPGAQSSSLAEGRVANVRSFLSNQIALTKGGIFLFLGVYCLDDYKDAKTWKDLLNTQEAIAFHYLNRAKLKADYKKCESALISGVNPLDDAEKKLMVTIKSFLKRSSDPFFHDVLFSFVKECDTREDILKFLSPLRDETMSVPGEVVTDAEEAFAALNEEMWDKLQAGIKEFFGSPETLERFIDITSDTFDIPYNPSRG